MKKNNEYDVAVIGAGPAGMMAAIAAAESGASVVLIEKNAIGGKKLLLTGGGRCNLTNAEFNLRSLVANYGANGSFLYHGFSEFGPQDVIVFFNGLGVETVAENKKRVFPKKGQAQEVLDALMKHMGSLGIEMMFESPVTGFEKKGNLAGPVVLGSGQTISAKNYVIATGGKSHPATGSAGDGYGWARGLGHEISAPLPGLVPIRTNEDWAKKLSGASLADPEIKVLQGDKKILTVLGEVLFTHFGLSGPAILNISAEIGKLMEKGDVSVSINLFPEKSRDQAEKMILEIFSKNPNRVLKNCLWDIMPQGLALAVSELAGVVPEKTANNITKEERRRLAGIVCDMRLTVAGLLDIEAGMVTNGGVSLKGVDDKTMRSKIMSNLFFAGEIIDVHGRTGGFNLQQCWSTGHLAGTSAARS